MSNDPGTPRKPRFAPRVALALSMSLALAACSPKGPDRSVPASSPAPEAMVAAAPLAEQPAAEAPSEPIAAERSEAESAARAIVAVATAAASEEDVAAFEEAIAELGSDAFLSQAEASLVEALAEATAAGRPAPGLHLALAAVYGRKGLAEKAYAAVQAAEAAAKAPGVGFSLAAIHGRKALLAPAAATGAFSLSVACDKPGAAVSLDGGAEQAAPVRFEALRPGAHEATVTLAGYLRFSTIVTGKDGDSVSVEASLEPAPVPLSIRTEPEGASLTVDGLAVGESPWDGTVTPGRHIVEASLDGYGPASASIEPAFASASNVERLALKPLPSYLSVTSEPAGATVWIGERVAGFTPIRIELDAPAEVRLRVAHTRKTYLEPEPRILSVRPGREYAEHVALEVGRSEVMMIASPTLPYGAKVLVNGVEVGTVPIGRLALTYGDMLLEIIAKGYEPWRRTITFTGSLPHISLTKVPQALAVRTIKIDGEPSDWDGIEPVSIDLTGDGRLPAGNGADVTGLCLAYDEKYLYARLDLADGTRKGRAKERSIYSVRLIGDKVDAASNAGCVLEVYYDVDTRAWKSDVNRITWSEAKGDSGWTKISDSLTFSMGESCIEYRVPKSVVSKYFKSGDRYLANAFYHVSGEWSLTADDMPQGLFAFSW